MKVQVYKAAGEKLKKLIEVLTNNRLYGRNCRSTCKLSVVQSSSATTVRVIGFANAESYGRYL